MENENNCFLWLARDIGGTLVCHISKPKLNGGYYYSPYMMPLTDDYYPQVTFENSPIKIEINI